MLSIIFGFLLLGTSAFCSSLTVYNTGHSGFALVSDKVDVTLNKGENDYQLKNVTDQIIVNSLIIENKDGVQLIIQDYKPDRSNTGFLLQNSIDKNVFITLREGNSISGKLLFFNSESITIEETYQKKITVIMQAQILSIEFPALTIDYTNLKPALFWKLESPKKQSTVLNYSYLTNGMNWKACYNAVWYEDENKLELNSQVVISNDTQKSFPLSKLKLVAGDVQLEEQVYHSYIEENTYAKMDVASMGRGFSQEKLSDFHLYSLEQKLDLPAMQSRQVQLYPIANISAHKYFLYNTYSDHLNGIIKFNNTKANGFGEPIPKGIIRLYAPDSESEKQFIADINIADHAIGEDVELLMGKAFDLEAHTYELDKRRDNRNQVVSADYKLEIENHSDKDAPVTIQHHLGNLYKVYHEEFDYEITENNQIKFNINVKAGSIKTVTWSQKK